MAITLQQEKKPVNWILMLTVALVVAVIFFGAYYLFFKKPELIEVVGPKSLEEINKISQLSFQPESVINSPSFKLLRRFETSLPSSTPGKANPFRP